MGDEIHQAFVLRLEVTEEVDKAQPAVEEEDHRSEPRGYSVVENLQRQDFNQTNERERERNVFDKKG
jgi:hypothetical protein